MTGISFLRPQYLILLVIVPIIILIYFGTLYYRKRYALKFANFDAIARIKGVDMLSKNIFLLVLTIFISIALIFSLSGMVVQRQISTSSSSFIITIDSSQSMEATDIYPTRFEAAKQTAIDFINSLPSGTKVGAVSFSGNAFVESDLTLDRYALKEKISAIPLSSLGGTDPSEAVLTATNLLEGESAKSIILLSDGRLNVGSVSELVDYANQRNVVVYTIGLGSEEGGTTSYGISTIDEEALRAIAYNTGGSYYRATTEDQLKNAYASIVTLKVKNVSFDISNYLVLVAFILFVIEYVLLNTRYKTIP